MIPVVAGSSTPSSVSAVRRSTAVSAPTSLRSRWANLISSASWSLPANTMITLSIGACCAVSGRCARRWASPVTARAVTRVWLTYRTRRSWMIVLTVRTLLSPATAS